MKSKEVLPGQINLRKLRKRNKDLILGTWNVLSLYRPKALVGGPKASIKESFDITQVESEEDQKLDGRTTSDTMLKSSELPIGQLKQRTRKNGEKRTRGERN